ncbi:recombinase family protein [Nocardioides marmoraquaticus]
MPAAPRRSAIYARISQDAEGLSAGVERQLRECRDLATRKGWTVAQEYVDNDISASHYSTKPRPGYDQMLRDITESVIDGVVVYSTDRLTRRPRELEDFNDAVRQSTDFQVEFVTGHADLGTDDGLLLARIQGAMAAKESANIGRRVKSRMLQNALDGKPHGGTVRPFGYADDKITVRADEASVVRDLVSRFLAGESGRSLATWLNEHEVASVTGKPWVTSTLKGMLTNPRYAGLRAHNGVVVGPAIWEAIITEDEHQRVLARYAAMKNSNRRTPQTYLLSGMLRCSLCGVRLYSSRRKDRRRYVCMKGPDHGGCGRMTIVAEPLERFLADAVLYRLDTPEMADALAGRSSADERTREVAAALDQAQEQIEELSHAYAARDITMREWMTARRPIQDRLEALQRQMAAATHTSALSGLTGNGHALRESWSGLNLSRQHSIMGAVIDHAVISPGLRGATTVDPGRVRVMWRH